MVKKLRAIGFDLDGTLVDSLGFSAQWVAAAASKASGRPVTENEARKYFGQPEPMIFKAMFPLEEAGKAEEAFSHYKELLSAQVSQMKLFSQVFEVFSILAEKKISVALYTTRGRWATDRILEHHQLKNHFAFTLAGDEVQKLKPDPEGILKLCENLSVSPKEFVYVGDSDYDVMAAHRAGAGAYHAVWAEGVNRNGEKALKSLGDLRTAIERGRLG